MRTTLKQTITSAWMLLAALAIGTASCSQSEEAPDAPNVATGNEPISISIAPKPAFEAGDAATRNADAEAQTRSTEADTRSTVDGDGNFAWAPADKVYVILTFSFADGTTADKVKEQLWVKANNTDNSTANNGWTVYTGWNANTANDTPLTANDMTWPLGAKTCKVQAFYTNCGYTIATNGTSLTSFTYADGQGDHMIFTKNDFAVGDDLAIAFKHATTRVTFTGLKPGTTYRLQLNDTEPTLHDSFKKEGFTFAGTKIHPFTTDDKGTFTRCLPLTNYINPTNGEVKFKLLTVDLNGITPITEGALKAQATGSTPAWKTNGLQYIMTAKDFAGDNNPDNDPDMLPPPPAKPGVTVHKLNGYYVSEVGLTDLYSWTYITADATNPCEKAGNGWRLPTMKDFEVMAGWSKSHPWDANNAAIVGAITALGTDATAFHKAFPTIANNKSYWASDSQDETKAYALYVKNTGEANYNSISKVANQYLRCVQPMNP